MNIQRPKISKQKIVIFSVFVVIATIFWFLDALNREYVTKIKYPIEFYNFPNGVQQNNSNIPKLIELNIKANGFDIIGKTNSNSAIKIDIQKTAVKNNKKYTIQLNKIIHNYFSKNIEILNIEPNTIEFNAVKIISKTVPVELDMECDFANLYMQSGKTEIVPKKVKITGSVKDVKSISSVKTKKIIYKNLSNTFKDSIELKKINNINFSEKTVYIKIPIERFTEGEITIPITIINCPNNILLKTFPNEISITYKVALSKYKSVQSNHFKLIVDYSKIPDKTTKKTKVELIEYPKYLKSVKVTTKYVNFIIEKKIN